MQNNDLIICTTGHRPERLQQQEKEISEWYAATLASLQPKVCISGMAKGADQIFATAAIDARVDLWCYFPFKKRYYTPQEEWIMDYAVGRKYFFDEYDKRSYFIRDKAMVDDSDIVLAVYDGNPVGGTHITIEYAKQQGKEIIYYPASSAKH